MTPDSDNFPHGTAVDEAAARWLVRQREGADDEADRAAFRAWLDADPAHRRAYEKAAMACRFASAHAEAPEIVALRAAALAAGPVEPVAWAARLRRARPWLAAAATVTAVATTATLVSLSPDGRPGAWLPNALVRPAPDADTALYRTAVGERTTVTLPDGSVATLDTDSSIHLAYSAGERGVRLLKGQALFEVAHNRTRPFHVYAAGRRVTALGTVFNVRMDGTRLRVALLEGSVRIDAVSPTSAPVPASTPEKGAAPPPAKPVLLRPGELFEAEPAGQAAVTAPADAEAQRMASWRRGVVFFEDMRLADAVAEINRYARRPIAIADPVVGQYRVSGIFRTGDPLRFSQAMAEAFPIRIEQTPDGGLILRQEDL